jgi:hypothetical protein
MAKRDIDGLKFVNTIIDKNTLCLMFEKNNKKYSIASMLKYPEAYQIITIMENGELDDDSCKDFESMDEIIKYVVEKI